MNLRKIHNLSNVGLFIWIFDKFFSLLFLNKWVIEGGSFFIKFNFPFFTFEILIMEYNSLNLFFNDLS